MWCGIRLILMKTKTSFLLMYISFFVYSLSGILSKIASQQAFFSPLYILCFCGIITVLAVYAVIWQQILKMIPLSVAMANKPIVLVFSILWAVLIFKENISIKTIAGIVLILCGIFIIGWTVNE